MHRKRAAEAGLDQAAAQYRSTVLNAFQNVADTLHALESDADALKAAVAAERAARRTLDLTRRQLELGAVNYLAVSPPNKPGSRHDKLVQARAGRFADSAALFMALGGGWWNGKDMASAQPAGRPLPLIGHDQHGNAIRMICVFKIQSQLNTLLT